MKRKNVGKPKGGGRREGITENDIVKAIRDLLRAMGIFHWKFSPGPFGAQAGIADILGCYEGRFIAIEVKKPGGRVSDAQERFLENIRDAGGVAFVAYGVEDVVRGLGLGDRVLF